MISSRHISLIESEIEPDRTITHERMNFCKPAVNYATDKKIKTETAERNNEYWEKYLKIKQDDSSSS